MPLTPLFSRGNLPATPWNLNSTSSTSSCNATCSLSPPPASCLPPPVPVRVHHLADHHQHWTLTFVIASFSHTNFITFGLWWIYSITDILRIFSQFWLRDYKNMYIFFEICCRYNFKVLMLHYLSIPIVWFSGKFVLGPIFCHFLLALCGLTDASSALSWNFIWRKVLLG